MQASPGEGEEKHAVLSGRRLVHLIHLPYPYTAKTDDEPIAIIPGTQRKREREIL